AQYVLVNVYVRHAGTVRVFSALTDQDGIYAATFMPLPNEAGFYQLGADHPGVPEPQVANQDQFNLLGMQAVPSKPSQTVIAGSTVTGTVQIISLSPIDLTQLTVTVDGVPDSLQVQTDLGSTLAAGATETLTYSITALDASVQRVQLQLKLSTVEGVKLIVPL